MGKKTHPTYITLTDKKSLNTMYIPANRAARRAHKRQQKAMAMLPPVLYPYVKDKNATEKK